MPCTTGRQRAASRIPSRSWAIGSGVVLVLFLVAAGAFGSHTQSTPSQPSTGRLAVGQQAPNFMTPDLHEHMHAFEAYRGHPVVLNFWATWCEPCRKEMPLLQTLYETHHHIGLILLAVSQDTSDRTDAIRSYVDASGFTFPVLLDPQGSIATSYNVQLLPSTIFVNAQGVVTAKHHGPMAQTQIERYLTTLLSR